MENANIVNVEETLYVLNKSIGVPGYDFKFEDLFACKHPIRIENKIKAIARLGATSDYEKRYKYFKDLNIELIHSPEEYNKTSYLPYWYPLIKDFTPKSIVFEVTPSVSDIENEFNWPVFLKGERQTSKHQRKLSIIESPDQFKEVMEIWKRDEILHWQKVVCRKFLKLRIVHDNEKASMPKSFEFRTFWWKDQCAGFGPYWKSKNYSLNETEEIEMLSVGKNVAKSLNVSFLVIDMAMTEAGDWIAIEVNDGQDSGYTGVNPYFMWKNLIEFKKSKL